MDKQAILLAWILHIIICFYLIRSIRALWLRAFLTLVPCFVLVVLGCSGLPYFHMGSIMVISLSWMVMIRLTDLIVLSADEELTFRSYLWKFFWLLFPIIPNQSTNPSIVFYFLLAVGKVFLTHWIHRWLSICEPSESYIRIFLFFIGVCAGTFFNDLQIVLVRLLTRDRYTVLEFNRYPFLSQSVREFWGRRYNLLISTLLKQSIFDPIRRRGFASPTLAALASFIVSGLLHGHVAVSGFGASTPFPAFLFFVLQGIACCIEVLSPISPPKPVKIILTQTFILLTAPLYLGLFTRAGPKYYELNPPMFMDATWLPRLPVPSTCPK